MLVCLYSCAGKDHSTKREPKGSFVSNLTYISQQLVSDMHTHTSESGMYNTKDNFSNIYLAYQEIFIIPRPNLNIKVIMPRSQKIK